MFQAFCKDNHVSLRALSHASLIREQLSELCDRAGVEQSSCGKDFSLVRKCLIYGLFNNVATHARDKLYIAVSIRINIKRYKNTSINIVFKNPLSKKLLVELLITFFVGFKSSMSCKNIF